MVVLVEGKGVSFVGRGWRSSVVVMPSLSGLEDIGCSILPFHIHCYLCQICLDGGLDLQKTA